MNTSVDKKINNIIKRIERHPSVAGLVLFGSRCNNSHNELSDVDLLIVIKDLNTSIEVLHPTIDNTNVRFDAWILPHSKLQIFLDYKLASDINPFIENAILTGKVIKDTNSLLAKAKLVIRNNYEISKPNVNLIRFRLTHGLESLERNRSANRFYFDLMYYHEIGQCLIEYGKLNNFQQKALKDILKQIEITNPTFYDLLLLPKESVKDKINHLHAIQEQVLLPINGWIKKNEFIATGPDSGDSKTQLQEGIELWNELAK